MDQQPDQQKKRLKAHHASKAFWVAAGFIALALGIIGIPLPLLPTTPFLILAAFCFGKSSDRLHDWLVTHPKLGPPIASWREHGAISKKGKIAAGLAMAAAFVISLIAGVASFILGIQAVVLALVSLFIFTRPTPPSS